MTRTKQQDILELVASAPNWDCLAGGSFDAYLDYLLPLTLDRSNRSTVAPVATEQSNRFTLVDSGPAYRRLWQHLAAYVRS